MPTDSVKNFSDVPRHFFPHPLSELTDSGFESVVALVEKEKERRAAVALENKRKEWATALYTEFCTTSTASWRHANGLIIVAVCCGNDNRIGVAPVSEDEGKVFKFIMMAIAKAYAEAMQYDIPDYI